MTLDFTCRKCDSGFELDAQDLIDGTEKLQCPNCDAKTSSSAVDDFTAALAELRAQVAALSKKFGVSLAIESEDLEAEGSDDDEDDEDDERDEDDVDEDDDDEDLDDDDEDADYEDEGDDDR